MNRAKKLYLAILRLDDLNRYRGLSGESRTRLSGLEISLQAVLEFGATEWSELAKLKKQGTQISLRFPKRPPLMSESASEAWSELERSFPWDEVRFAEDEADPFVTEGRLDVERIRASGEHPARWVRRYGKTQIHEVLSHRRLQGVTSLIVAHSGRFDELDEFLRAWVG